MTPQGNCTSSKYGCTWVFSESPRLLYIKANMNLHGGKVDPQGYCTSSQCECTWVGDVNHQAY